MHIEIYHAETGAVIVIDDDADAILAALSVARLWNMPSAVREYLTTLEETKRGAAHAVAYDTARAAARSAARDAAKWTMARNATLAAARADFQRRVDEAL